MAVLSLCSYISVDEATLLPAYVVSKVCYISVFVYLFVCILYNDPFSRSYYMWARWIRCW